MLLMVAAYAISGGTLAAQVSFSGIGAECVVKVFEYNDDSLKIKMLVDLVDVEIQSKYGVCYTPMIKGAKNLIELPSIHLRGRNRNKVYNRSVALMSRDERAKFISGDSIYRIVEDFGRHSKMLENYMVEYNYSVPYEPWMASSQLKLESVINGCGIDQNIPVTTVLENNLTINIEDVDSYIVAPELIYIRPEAVAHKTRSVSYGSQLTFAVNSSKLNMSTTRNQVELGKIDAMVELVEGDSDLKVSSVNIIGYASPDGSLHSNKILSEERASALEAYLKSKYSINADLYNVEFGGENWEGLIDMIMSIDMNHSDEVLDIIEGVAIVNGRETLLATLRGGVPYRYMVKNLFPSLRKVIVEIAYEVSAYDIDRIEEVLNENPQNLSLDEMYRLSETYELGSDKFVNIFMKAVELFPKNGVAQHNAVVTALISGEVEVASKFLNGMNSSVDQASNANTLGVYYMMSGDYAKAHEELYKAKALGSIEAIHNISELAKKITNIEMIKSADMLRRKVYGQ